jgi:hypothetical protein
MPSFHPNVVHAVNAALEFVEETFDSAHSRGERAPLIEALSYLNAAEASLPYGTERPERVCDVRIGLDYAIDVLRNYEDADCDEDGFIPNDAMRVLVEVQAGRDALPRMVLEIHNAAVVLEMMR